MQEDSVTATSQRRRYAHRGQSTAVSSTGCTHRIWRQVGDYRASTSCGREVDIESTTTEASAVTCATCRRLEQERKIDE